MYETVARPTNIVTINHDETVTAAAVMMQKEKIGCLIVVDKTGKFVGLLTERDIAHRIAVSLADINNTTVKEIMTSRIVSCSPGTPTSKAREIMATNQIRHLPIVTDGVVVGIFSIRDLMQQQLLEDRAAAKEVAMLSKCLKSIDLNEAANIVTKEVPKLFHAEKCVLCLFNNNADTEKTELLSYNKCPCPEKCLKNQIPEVMISSKKIVEAKLLEGQQFTYDSIPNICCEHGAKGPRLIIPLAVSGAKEERRKISKNTDVFGNLSDNNTKDSENKKLYGYLCMCGLANSNNLNKELTGYKANLTKEILDSHLTNASLYQHARLTSLTDALTGIGSRKLLEDRLQTEAERAKRYKRSFSVAIIDLDNFKTINDVLGHADGDEALRKLAACMKEQKRTSDVLARYGGDEFVILMPETKVKDAVVLLERIRAEVQKIYVAENFSMTISCGIAQSLHEKEYSSGEVIRRADLALYEAKSAGRNCVKKWDKSMSKQLSADDIEMEKIKKLKRRIAGLSEQAEKMFVQSIWGLVQALEAKDPYSKKHSEHVMHYAAGIAQTLGLSQKQVEVIHRAGMIHDIGKIGIPDAIISNPKRLSPRQRSIIEQHPLIAVRILEKMSFLEPEVNIVKYHHEKWNGQGYPEGLAENAIPIGSRILAVADSLDALTSDRSYHKSKPLDEAVKILQDSSKYDFDPEVVQALVSWIEKIRSESDQTYQLIPKDLFDSVKPPKPTVDLETTCELIEKAIVTS
ncbi:diguanylate cyclase [Planctomycetota bacterium]